MTRTIKIATRESKLALWQARHVRDLIQAAHADVKVEIVGMTTEGDRNKQSPLSQIGGKGVFVKELELALIDGSADIAVHSMKDVPSILPAGLMIAAIVKRADPRDAFVSVRYQRLSEVPAGGKIGSSSLRRRLQLKAAFSELQYLELRGNVDTRLGKLDAGEFDGIILAVAGLQRLGLDRVTQALDTGYCIPSAGQGAVGIECRSDDSEIIQMLESINHEQTSVCVACERRITASLEATCNLPIAAFAEITGGTISVQTFVSDESGDQSLRESISGPVEDASRLADDLTRKLLDRGAETLIRPGTR